MGCDIVFKVNGILDGGQSVDGQPSNQIILKNSQLLSDANLVGKNESLKKILGVSLENIARELTQPNFSKQKNALVELVKSLKDTSSIPRTGTDIKVNGIVGNYKYHTLKMKYAGRVTFPNLQTPYDPDILLLDSFTVSGTSGLDMIYGTDANGRQVIAVKDSDAGVMRLANYLRVRDLILNQYENNPELEELLPQISKSVEKTFNSQKELLLDFISDNSKYMQIGGAVYGLLNEIVSNLKNSKRAEYTVSLDREFFHTLNKVRGTKYDYTISKLKFTDIIKKHSPELLQDLTKEQLNDDQVLAELFDKFYPNFTEFVGKLVSISDDKLTIRTLPRTAEAAYGLTYSTIPQKTKLEESYRGYNIYQYTDKNGRVKYLYTQDALNPKTYIQKLYNSSDEIKSIIDNDYESNLTFSGNFETGFRMIPPFERVNSVFSNKWHEAGSVVKVLDIELNRNTILDPDEESLLKGDMMLSDFYNTFKKQLTEDQFNDLKRVVDSIETAGIFIYLINERTGIQSNRNLQEGTEFEDILQEISSAQENDAYKYFFIQECSGSKGNYFIKMIPIKSDVQVNEKYNRPEPIIGLMDEVIDEFNRIFKVGATLLTQDEISQQFPDVPVGTKAFIREGNIYINGSVATSEDVVHEYTHLFLGALKAQNYDMYTKLLDRVMRSTASKVTRMRDIIERRYPNLARQDKDEEIFVALFADFLSGKDTSNMFDDVKEAVDSEMKTIFNLATDEDFNSLYKGRVDQIFQTFSKDIGKVGNGLDYSRGTVFRQAANWIEKQIERGNIIEKC